MRGPAPAPPSLSRLAVVSMFLERRSRKDWCWFAVVLPQIVAIISSPQQFNIPAWFLNRKRDVKDGRSRHVAANNLDTVWREDFERMKRIRLHRWAAPCVGCCAGGRLSFLRAEVGHGAMLTGVFCFLL